MMVKEAFEKGLGTDGGKTEWFGVVPVSRMMDSGNRLFS